MTKGNVAFLDPAVLYVDLRARLERHVRLIDLSAADPATLRRSISSLDVLLHHNRIEISAEMFDAAPRLRAVMAPGAGFDGIDVEAATRAGVLVTNHAGGNSEAVAEHAIGLLLGLAKKIALGDRHIRAGKPWRPAIFPNNEIHGRTLGIIGLGAIGRRLAAIAASGFAMRVLATDPHVAAPPEGVELCPIETVLSSSDVLCICVPLNAATRGLIGRPELARVKPGVILINIARGHILDHAALIEALRDRRVAAAGLDVFDDDRLDLGDPILGFDNVILTPHIAGATVESLARKAVRQAEAALAILNGEIPETATLLNPAAVPAFRSRFAADGATHA